jgi:hypothetical protein
VNGFLFLSESAKPNWQCCVSMLQFPLLFIRIVEITAKKNLLSPVPFPHRGLLYLVMSLQKADGQWNRRGIYWIAKRLLASKFVFCYIEFVPLLNINNIKLQHPTASVVQWTEFLVTDPEISGSIPGATTFSEKLWI